MRQLQLHVFGKEPTGPIWLLIDGVLHYDPWLAEPLPASVVLRS
jgi:hypothetical protein